MNQLRIQILENMEVHRTKKHKTLTVKTLQFFLVKSIHFKISPDILVSSIMGMKIDD